MSIFVIIAICFLIWMVIGGITVFGVIGEACCYMFEDDDSMIKAQIIASICVFVLFIASIFIGIGINTESEKIYVKEYLAKKETIEASLEIELSGLERLEIVKQVTELNGEIAERKASFELWHFVVYDNTIYDGVELIKLNKELQNEISTE